MPLIGFLLFAAAAYTAIDQYVVLGNAVLKSVMAVLASAVLSSIVFCLCLFSGMGFWVFNILAIVLPSAYLFFAIKKQGYRFKANISSFSFPALLVILGGLAYFSSGFFQASYRWGDWDAIAIWTQHARFLLREDSFYKLFTNDIAWSHPDYPLLLPSLVAMFWQVSYSAFVPAIIGYVAAVLLLLIVGMSFIERKSYILGLILFLILACSQVLFPFVVSQCADTLTAVFILLPFVLHKHLPQRNPSANLFLIGFFAAACGWIKNEGLAFFFLFSVCFVIKYLKRLNWVKWYALGALLPLAMIVVFKFGYAPANDIVNANETNYAARLTDAARYKQIFDYMYTYMSENCQLLYYSLGCIALLRYRFLYSFGFVVVLLLFISYFFAYVISPNDLDWHLSTSFARLVHQIFPAAIYLIFLAVADKFSIAGGKSRFATSMKV